MFVRDLRLSHVALAALAFLPTACSPGDGDAMDSPGDAVIVASGDGQAVSLGQPTGEFPEDFGAIQTVRELSGGDVLVADPLGGALYRVDFAAGERVQVGAEGQGPEEYRQPDAVWSLPGDSTLLIDLGNGRMTALAPDLSFGETSPLSAGDPRSGMIIALPQGVDDQGRVYARSMGMGMGSQPDSGAVLRVTRGTFEVDTAATFKLRDQEVTRSGSADNQNVSVSPVPLSPEDAWGVAPDGSVVVARVGDYSIEWRGPDGSVTRGPATEYDAVSIGTAEKEEFLRAQGQAGGGIGIGVSMGPGGMEMSFSRGGMGGQDQSIDDYTWPDVKPPFYSDRIPVDPMSRAWVRRHVEAGEPTTYDVFDRSGERVATFELPHASRVVGFGEASVYVVEPDEFDLNYLKRYAMPRM